MRCSLDRNIPSYVVHYTPNVQRRKILENVHKREQLENVTWITEYDKEVITYEMYTKAFQADHLEYQKRGQDPNEFFPHYPLQPAMVSLQLKQKEAFRRIGYGNAPFGIMFEDDAIICENFRERFRGYMEEIPSNWDVAFIGQGGGKRIKEVKEGVHWYLKGHPADRCADSVILKKEAALKIYTHMEAHKVCFNPDPELGFWMKVLSMNVYWLEPPIVVQGSQNGLYETVQPLHSRFIDLTMQVRSDMVDILKEVNSNIT